MNLILFTQNDKTSKDTISLSDRRFDHIQSIHKAEIGDFLKVGEIDGKMGTGEVLSIDNNKIELKIELSEQPPKKIPLTLVMAMSRPKSFKKALHYAIAMGVKEIHITRTWRVDKSYLGSPLLEEKSLYEQSILALEQAKDTILPKILIHKQFKPFVEDTLSQIIKDKLPLLAHPYTTKTCPQAINEPTCLFIGPEGGLIEYEVELLTQIGFKPVNIGDRILRVENAVPAIIGRLF